MDSGVRDSLFSKTLNRDSVESDGHGALFGIPATNILTLQEIWHLFNPELQFTELFTEGFSQVFASVRDDLLEEAAALNAVGKEFGRYWSAQPSSMPIAVVQPWRHDPIVFLAGQLPGV